MVATIAPVMSPSHAGGYYENSEHADYYLKGDVCPSFWFGRGTALIGLEGQVVERNRFERLLRGEVQGQRIGCERGGKWLHRPGYDVTFSAPKSVSIVCLIGQDSRILAAQDDAVIVAGRFIESCIAVRMHTRSIDGRDQYHKALTDNLAAAVFRHATSRPTAQDPFPSPQLHNHMVVLNATFTDEGVWRSIDSHDLYRIQTQAGLVYRQTLSANLRALGYSIEGRPGGQFEIRGVSREVVNAFSPRRREIDEKLTSLGYSRDTAPTAVKERLAHEGREAKTSIQREEFREYWRKIASELGLDVECVVSDAVSKSSMHGFDRKRMEADQVRVQVLLEKAIRAQSERQSVFTRDAVSEALLPDLVCKGLSSKELSKAFDRMVADGRLIGGRCTKQFSASLSRWLDVEGYTTPEAIRAEMALIGELRRAASRAIFSVTNREADLVIAEAERNSVEAGFKPWSLERKHALSGILCGNDAIVGLQGSAGTSKTSSILRASCASYVGHGFDVIGLATSVSACESLANGADIDDVYTVAKYCRSGGRVWKRSPASRGLVMLVDEASLISTRDMNQLIRIANRQGAKLIVVGDTEQLGSVEAGAAYRQLQLAGMKTFVLTEVVRQENTRLLDAVYDIHNGHVSASFEKLEAGGGNVLEIRGSSAERHRRIVEHYCSLSSAAREKTLLIDPVRVGRDKLNRSVREALKNAGEIESQSIDTCRLERVDLTRSARQDAASYSVGQLVTFARAYKRKGISKRSYWRVSAVDHRSGVVHLVGKSGEVVNWSPAQWGEKSEVFDQLAASVSPGDKLIWARNDRESGLVNGTRVSVLKIDPEKSTALLETSTGAIRTVHLAEMQSQHWNYGYVSTVHACQGRTAERVIYHAESSRHNLASRKALYVAISRATTEVFIYTDDRTRLIERVQAYEGEKQNAISAPEITLDHER